MKQIKELPLKYDHINNYEMRALFEDDEVEPLLFQYFEPCGYVGNRPNDCDEEHHEDDTWAIDVWDEDKEGVIYSFLYVSEFEYKEDLKILNLL